MAWYDNVKAVLMDVNGVLYTSGGRDIPGSVDALNKLQAAGIPFKLLTNQSTESRHDFTVRLQGLGFNISDEDVICPAPYLVDMLRARGLRPHLLVHPDVWSDFAALDTSNPNCVVIGDAQEHFTYSSLNAAFRALLILKEKTLITIGSSKYYKEGEELVLDAAAFTKALEYACDTPVINVGKPQKEFFNVALSQLGVTANECVMIGDDIMGDVSGAQSAGIKGVLVRTGKYRLEDEPHPAVTPDAYVDDLKEAIKFILDARSN